MKFFFLVMFVTIGLTLIFGEPLEEDVVHFLGFCTSKSQRNLADFLTPWVFGLPFSPVSMKLGFGCFCLGALRAERFAKKTRPPESWFCL